jgi:hypothetical protein
VFLPLAARECHWQQQLLPHLCFRCCCCPTCVSAAAAAAAAALPVSQLLLLLLLLLLPHLCLRCCCCCCCCPTCVSASLPMRACPSGSSQGWGRCAPWASHPAAQQQQQQQQQRQQHMACQIQYRPCTGPLLRAVGHVVVGTWGANMQTMLARHVRRDCYSACCSVHA